MDAYLRLLRPLLFRLDPETVHNVAIWAIARGLIKGKLLRDPRLATSAFGCSFVNPLGLAAGVDKTGACVQRWSGMGFGFAEIGTFTALSQPGNPRPRLFRLPDEKAILNRMGFNNPGSEAAAVAIRSQQRDYPLGINLGKSKVTELADAPADYAQSYGRLAPLADYVVVNVSSPNTPGLRDLQAADQLREILVAILSVGAPKPLFVKLAPDLALDDLHRIAELGSDLGVTGYIATNTTIDYARVREKIEGPGGLSGLPVRALSNGVLAELSRVCPAETVLIGVGGVFDGQDLWDKFSRGAALVQTYTGWVYGGPLMPYRALLGLLALMNDRGVKKLSDIPRVKNA